MSIVFLIDNLFLVLFVFKQGLLIDFFLVQILARSKCILNYLKVSYWRANAYKIDTFYTYKFRKQ